MSQSNREFPRRFPGEQRRTKRPVGKGGVGSPARAAVFSSQGMSPNSGQGIKSYGPPAV